jgi:hypothetical protein
VGFQAAIARVFKASMTRGDLVEAKICDFPTPWLSREFERPGQPAPLLQAGPRGKGAREDKVLTRSRTDDPQGAPSPQL